MWASAFLLFGVVVVVCGAGGIALLLAAQQLRRQARVAAGTAAFIVAAYVVVLLASGVWSSPRVLGLGEEKHICEIDCHLAYAVESAQRTGNALVVTLRMRFDETTIGRERGSAPVYPGPRRIALIDASGRQYQPLRSSNLDTPLQPGASTSIVLEFALPQSTAPARLRFEDADPIKRLLIGSETALLHKHVDFRLS